MLSIQGRKFSIEIGGVYLFIHLGGDTLVRTDEIIALINLESTQGAQSSSDLLKTLEAKGRVEKLASNNHKSAVIMTNKVILSPISTVTLKKRADFIDNL